MLPTSGGNLCLMKEWTIRGTPKQRSSHCKRIRGLRLKFGENINDLEPSCNLNFLRNQGGKGVQTGSISPIVRNIETK